MLNKMEKSICRLCFNLAKNDGEPIGEVTRQICEVLLLELDLNATINPILCKDCARVTKELFYFKSACIETEEIVLTFCLAKKQTDFDIKEVYEEVKNINVAYEDFNVCRFCMNQIRKNKSVSLHVLMNDVMYVEMLPVLMPEVVGTDPVICMPCRVNLERYFNFVRNCLDIEEKINKFRQSQERNSTNPIELSNVLRFLSKDRLGYPAEGAEVTVIKQESLSEDQEDVGSQTDLQIKSEPLHIKDEDVSIEKSIGCRVNSRIFKDESDESSVSPRKSAPNATERTQEMCKCDEGDDYCVICLIQSNAMASRMKRVGKEKCKNALRVDKRAGRKKVKTYKCEICVYETKYERCLKTHTLIHRDVPKVYKCGICAYETILKKSLKRHMLIHRDPSEVEMHKCGICDYEAKFKQYLKYHMLVHE